MKIIQICLVLGLFITGCDILETDVPSSVKEFEVNFSNLPQLPDSLEYVSWILSKEGTAFYRLERFTPVNGSFSKVYTDIKSGYIQSMQVLVVSIEFKATHDTLLIKPSDVPILSGYLNGNQAAISFSEDNSMPKFDGVAGDYLLATPTDTLTVSETSGIWFVNKDSTGTLMAGLTLPALPAGWFYQGWIEKDGKLLTTGSFQKAADADNSAEYSGSVEGYAFPGEDFINNPPAGVTFPLDLIGAKVYITLQPKYDLKGSSYGFKILEGQVSVGSEPGKVYQLQVSTFTQPSGNVKLKWQI